MAWRLGVAPTTTSHSSFPFVSSSSSSSSSSGILVSVPFVYSRPSGMGVECSYSYPSLSRRTQSIPLSHSSSTTHICKAAEYKFPDPIPEFAVAEAEKFTTHLRKKLEKKDIYGDSVEEVLRICTEIRAIMRGSQSLSKPSFLIFSDFLHTHYGGPGTLLVLPFIDMADTVNERELPGGPQAARAAVKWAQKHVDKDWKDWTGDSD